MKSEGRSNTLCGKTCPKKEYLPGNYRKKGVCEAGTTVNICFQIVSVSPLFPFHLFKRKIVVRLVRLYERTPVFIQQGKLKEK